MVVDEGTSNNFVPIPILDPANATLVLAFASPSVVYTAASDDLWLSAHSEGVQTIWDRDAPGQQTNLTVYYPDKQVSVLACLEQHQICNPNAGSGQQSCTQFRSMYHQFSDEELQEVLTTERQMAVVGNLLGSILGLDYYIDETTLLAESIAAYGMSLPLASDQWMQEVKNWFTIGLATTQRFMLEYVTGPADSQYSSFINTTVAATDPNVAWLCENQIINRGDYTNFRTLTISLIFALGIIVYAANQSLEFITGAVRDRYTSGRWRQQAWWAEGTLQLQRRTFEGAGIKWDSDEWDRIPVTEKGITFPALRTWEEMAPLNPGKNEGSAKTSQKLSERKTATTNLQTTDPESVDGDEQGEELRRTDTKPQCIVHVDSFATFVEHEGIQRTDTGKKNAIVQVDSCSTFDSEGSGTSSRGDEDVEDERRSV